VLATGSALAGGLGKVFVAVLLFSVQRMYWVCSVCAFLFEVTVLLLRWDRGELFAVSLLDGGKCSRSDLHLQDALAQVSG